MIRRRHPSIRVPVSLTAIVASLALLAGCTSDPFAEDFTSGGTSLTSTEDAVQEYPASERADPVSFDGVTESGDAFSTDDHLGQVLVVNLWYATCAPCQAEAATLEKAWEASGDGVQFVGINILDQAETAQSFMDDYGVTYPSVIDATDGKAKQALAGAVPVQSTPSTLVIDKEGRPAALIIGQVESTSVLNTLIADVAAE